jgi:hypothetical protein
LHDDLVVVAPEQQRCLLQSAYNVVTVLPLKLLPTKAPDSREVWDGANRTVDKTMEEAKDDVFKRIGGYWKAVAEKLASYWLQIVILFTLGFSILVPLIHWQFEDRTVEMDIFTKCESRETEVVGVAPPSVSVPSDASLLSTSQPQTASSGRSARARLGDRFSGIRINAYGGQKKVATLLEHDRPSLRRPIKVTVRTLSIAFNIFMLVQQDVTLLRGASDYYAGEETLLPKTLKEYLEITKEYNSLITVRHAVCVCVAELLGLSAMLIWMSYRFAVFWVCRKNPKVQFDAFYSLYESFDCFSLLSGFSALRLVNLAHPALLTRRFQFFIERPFMGGGNYSSAFKGFQLLYFIVTRVVAVVLGALAFGVKIAFVSVQVQMKIEKRDGAGAEIHYYLAAIWRWLIVVMLLIQTLGAVGVENVLWWRMLLVVVEGGHRRVTLARIRLANVYLSKIMQLIYENYMCKGNYMGFLLILLTFDHIDLQHLMIDEESKGVAADDGMGEIPLAPDALGEILTALQF